MSAYRFSCPNCGQHIECDTAYAGTQIQCPSCQQEMVIPSPPSPDPAAPKPGPLRVRVNPPSSAGAPAPAKGPELHSRAHGVAPLDAHMAEGDGKGKKRGLLPLVAIAVGLVVVLALAIPLFHRWQTRLNEARDAEEGAGLLGDGVGHIADLYNTLDATDPSKMSRRDQESPDSAGDNRPAPSQSVTVGSGVSSLEHLPLAKARWSPDPPESIPDGRANGSLAGSDFVVQNALLILGRSGPILSLRQGADRIPDREVLIYLQSPGGHLPERGKWTVRSTDTTAPARVMVLWKSAERAALQQKSYSGGFGLKLEFGTRTGEVLPGRLFLALPDPSRSVVEGLFQATVRAAGTAQPQTAQSSPGPAEESQ